MKRLTERSLDYCTQHCPSEKMISCAFYKDGQAERCLIANMYDRLAAYEDTGLEPEEVKEITSWSYGPFHKKMGDWLKAEREGRLVVLPCKVGKHLYAATRNIISEFEVKGFELDGSGMVWVTWEVVSGMYGHFRIDGIPDDAIGKTVFLTRAEAEKAMEVSDDA